MRKIGVFFKGHFVPVLCKIGVKMAENVLETPRNRGKILGCGTIMVTPLHIEWRHRDWCSLPSRKTKQAIRRTDTSYARRYTRSLSTVAGSVVAQNESTLMPRIHRRWSHGCMRPMTDIFKLCNLLKPKHMAIEPSQHLPMFSRIPCRQK